MLKIFSHFGTNQQVRFSALLSLVLVSTILWLSGAWLAQSLDPVPIPSLPELSPSSQVSAFTSGVHNLLYGETDKPISQQNLSRVASEKLADTRLKLQLLGTIKTGKVGVAILADGGNTLVVSEGEQVINGVELVEVAADYVVLLHRGQHERLAMEDRVAGLVTDESGNKLTESTEGLNLSNAEQQRLKKINNEIRENPMRMGNYVRFKGVKKNDAWVGIEVSPRREHKIFEAMGLKPGDLIKSINGAQIQELADAPTLWNRFLQESRFDLQVERNGLLETISVDLTNITE
ncbi:MAG: hypothetical protein IBX48_06840 [Thiomicrospira sp.]|uniref:type II secretion system protein N n=1 Tax=Thiomicrospira sp. TaxID=935 RepID=UPI001A058C82|nr:type II secretion system protein N [Thiomicrospira sp.]MBE0494044.1 hypothetical protein [Thiomicrospira sp.]